MVNKILMKSAYNWQPGVRHICGYSELLKKISTALLMSMNVTDFGGLHRSQSSNDWHFVQHNFLKRNLREARKGGFIL